VESVKSTRKTPLKTKNYEKALAKLQVELVKLQEWIKFKKLKVVVLFEGRDAAGKGGTIKRITESLSPRVTRVAALPAPTDRETGQWYFQRYVQHLPAGGEMVLFDRSWYNRAGVERVMGFCTDEEYREFLRSCPEFERMLVRSGIILIKYWFSVSNEEQERRFQKRIFHPEKHWKLSPMDLQSRARWVEYSRAKDAMFAHTDIKQAPWYVVDGDDKKRARLNVITHLLNMIDYEDLTPAADRPAAPAGGGRLRAAADVRPDFHSGSVLSERPLRALPEEASQHRPHKPACCRLQRKKNPAVAGFFCVTPITALTPVARDLVSPAAGTLLVIADRTDLVADLGDVHHLVHRIGLSGTRPHVGDFDNHSILGGRVNLDTERLAGLVLEILQALADQ
jgi:polyphosphate kinase 2